MAKINSSKVNTVTIEDPVEYHIVGVNQVQVNPAAGLTFATALRAFLRQDPNIILVGEIRDRETTELAIQAALTGHLVFSTLHTSNAAGAIPRFIDLGGEPFLLASSLNAVVGQRILRKVCPSCKEDFMPPEIMVNDIKSVLGRFLPPDKAEPGKLKLFRGKGCKECGDTGFLGRIGIFEVLPVSDAVAKLVLSHADANEIEKRAVEEGMITMKQDGYLKAIEGLTTIEEVLRVAQD
jgi:type II secretory ATPase GspE/PulE/Tfp pilus assembly ATPase PilB-like protein